MATVTLQSWGVTFGVVSLFPCLCVQDIFKHCTEEHITSVTEIPYLDGDFWPNLIEETIKELDLEGEQKEASESGTKVCY